MILNEYDLSGSHSQRKIMLNGIQRSIQTPLIAHFGIDSEVVCFLFLLLFENTISTLSLSFGNLE